MPKIQPLFQDKYRDNPRLIARYLNDVLTTGDAAAIVKAIGDMMRAQGIVSISKKSGLRRESLYRSFSGQMSPGFERVLEVLLTMDVKLVAKPINAK
jgi:probable addiction module antidote protein